MQALYKVWCRSVQAAFSISAHFLTWRKAERVTGSGSLRRIPCLLAALQVEKPIIVTDAGLMKAGIAARLLDALNDAGMPYVLFDSVEANPSVQTAEAIARLYGDTDCDVFVAVGGGSVLDAAKAAAALSAGFCKKTNWLGSLLHLQALGIQKPAPPLIAVPTTAGTGSETTIAAMLTDTGTHHKFAVMDLRLIPRYAVLDASLTVGLPPFVTGATGMDALAHAVEAYLSWGYNTRESRRCAEEAVRAIFAYLERAYVDGADLEARAAMQAAAYQAGYAFTRAGVGNAHAIAHTLSGLYGTMHALAAAVVLPAVLEDYGEEASPKLARLAAAAGLSVPGGRAALAQAFIRRIREMNASMGIPEGFDFILDGDIPQLVRWAGAEANPFYPVPVLYGPERFRSVIEKIRISAAAKETTAAHR